MTRKLALDGVIAAALTAAVAIVYWPGVHADWIRDDFLQVAFSRMLGTPWLLFVTDHFHLAASHWRPLGYASMWLTAALCGNSHACHAIVQAAIHAGVVLSLFHLMRAAVPRGWAFFGALLYAIHPAVIGAALWYADPGHLATMFVLIAMRGAYDYRDGKRGSLAVVAIASLAAMLAKEIGVVVVAPITVLWCMAMAMPDQRVRMRRGLAWVWGAAIVYLLWRRAVLGTFGSVMTGKEILLPLFSDGIGAWLDGVADYGSLWPRLAAPQRWVLTSCAVLLIVIVAADMLRSTAAAWRGRRAEMLLTGLVLAIVPGIVQAPVSALNLAQLTASMSAVDVVMNARLYYTSFAGIAVVATVCIAAAAPQDANAGRRIAMAVVLASLIAAFATIARQTIEDYRARSVAIAQVARAAAAAVEAHELPARRCHVVLLGIQPSPEWDLYVSMDSVVKATSPDLRKVAHCLIHTDLPTFVYLLPAGTAATFDAGPFTTRQANGRPLLPRRVGDVEMAYFEPPSTVTAGDAKGFVILSYEDGRFRDIGADVVSGKRTVKLRPVP